VLLILSASLVQLLASSGFDFDPLSEQPEKRHPFYLLLKATDEDGNSALFSLTQHGFKWDDLPDCYKREVLSRNVVALEQLGSIEEQANAQRLISRESLDPKLLWADAPWFFPQNHEEYQDLFSTVARHFAERGIDYSYLEDISKVRPGVLAYLCVSILPRFHPASMCFKEGMDDKIESIFSTTPNRSVVALETAQNLFDCFGIKNASYEDVAEDLDFESLQNYVRYLTEKYEPETETTQVMYAPSFYAHEPEPSTFTQAFVALETEMDQELQQPTLVVFDHTIGKRNKIWMPTILNLIKQNNAVIAAGTFHFLKHDGILSLGHQLDLNWYYFNKDGEWAAFIYLL
jgi:hypothetical protein